MVIENKEDEFFFIMRNIREDRPMAVMLVGMPATGKSTWADKIIDYIAFAPFGYNPNVPSTDFRIIGTDRIIDQLADVLNMTYNDLFNYKDIPKIAERVMYAKLADHISVGRSIFWDQTNLSVKSRGQKLARIPKNYFKVAMNFDIPPDIDFRLGDRPGKNIPPHIIESMKASYEAPTTDEGFDAVLNVKGW